MPSVALSSQLALVLRVFPEARVFEGPPPLPVGLAGASCGPAAPLLDYVRTRPRVYCVQYAQSGARFVQLAAANGVKTHKLGTGHQRPITGASYGSLRRLSKRLEAIAWGTYAAPRRSPRKKGFFITLTWRKMPNEVGKRELDIFLKRFFRRWPLASVCWRLEFQERGVPHYHLIVGFPHVVSAVELRAWVSKNWKQIIKDQTAVVQGVHGIYGGGSTLSNYLAGYVSKQDEVQTGVLTGRVWSFCGLGFNMQVRFYHNFEIEQMIQLARRLRRWARGKSRFLSNVRENFRGYLSLDPPVLTALMQNL